MKKALLFIISLCLTSLSFSDETNSSEKAEQSEQILLRNYMAFKEGQESGGASAFVIKYKEKMYAVTAKHMLNGAMGIKPVIKPSEFNEQLKTWTLSTPDTEEVVAEISSILNPSDNWNRDIILLTLKRYKDNSFKVLNVSSKQPKKGDIFHIMGCPYAEKDCKQNKYTLMYEAPLEDGMHTFVWDNKTISLSGFSGAPIVDDEGNAFATYRGNRKTVHFGGSVLSELQRNQ